EQGSSTRELGKLREKNEKLAAKVLKLEGEMIDLRGKQENFSAQAKENRELKAALDKAIKDLRDQTEWGRKLEEELGEVKSAM
ncbi:hypothetical protein A2U01_0089840, partial [Trifolium medium]|nr:hypothetical protein [Trifolium medium]